VKRASLLLGLAILPFGWAAAAGSWGMTGHMIGHMVAVAIAAPLIAWGMGGTAFDLAARWPRAVTPLGAMVVELMVVWGWHLPVARGFAESSSATMMLEQAMFLGAGLLLWAAVLGTGANRRAAGIGALLLTSMHMTLLGALIGLAPRPLYPEMVAHGHMPLEEQQLGGVVMLTVGAGSYLLGGLAMLGSLLSGGRARRT